MAVQNFHYAIDGRWARTFWHKHEGQELNPEWDAAARFAEMLSAGLVPADAEMIAENVAFVVDRSVLGGPGAYVVETDVVRVFPHLYNIVWGAGGKVVGFHWQKLVTSDDPDEYKGLEACCELDDTWDADAFEAELRRRYAIPSNFERICANTPVVADDTLAEVGSYALAGGVLKVRL